MAGLIHPTAILDEPVTLGEGVRIWHFCHLMAGAQVGAGSSLGQGVFVAGSVRIGAGVRVQNHVSLYDGVTLEDDVFCGPSCVFTNVTHPRAALSRKAEYRPTLVKLGATLGANCTLLCGAILGCYCFVGAGAVVAAREYPAFALLVGVPARRVGWVSHFGHRLSRSSPEDPVLRCPESGWRYVEREPERLECLDFPEDRSLRAR